jgi:chorismate mutase-like protein
MPLKTMTICVIAASGLAVLWAPDVGADEIIPLQGLVDAAAERLQAADPVAASKFRTGGQVDDPEREQQVIDAVTADATSARVDPGYVHDVFRNQIDATDSVEHSRLRSKSSTVHRLRCPRLTCRHRGTPLMRPITPSSARSPINGRHCILRRAAATATAPLTPSRGQGISTPSTAKLWTTQHTHTAGRPGCMTGGKMGLSDPDACSKRSDGPHRLPLHLGSEGDPCDA